MASFTDRTVLAEAAAVSEAASEPGTNQTQQSKIITPLHNNQRARTLELTTPRMEIANN
jgi:hypothetical protein